MPEARQTTGRRVRLFDVVIVERWPDVPGHPGRTITRRGRCEAISEDGAWWLVRERGLFKRWHWRPRQGMFVTLHRVADTGPTREENPT